MHSTPLSSAAGTVAGEAAAFVMRKLAQKMNAGAFQQRLMSIGGRIVAHQIVGSVVNVSAIDPIGLAATPVTAVGHAIVADLIENSAFSPSCLLE